MRVVLNCPYEQRNQAKALGARWDPAIKKWYVDDPKDLAPFAQWLPDDVAAFVQQQGADAATRTPSRKAPARRQSTAPAAPAPAPLAPWPPAGAETGADDGPPWD
jgi:hypothetical protein